MKILDVVGVMMNKFPMNIVVKKYQLVLETMREVEVVVRGRFPKNKYAEEVVGVRIDRFLKDTIVEKHQLVVDTLGEVQVVMARFLKDIIVQEMCQLVVVILLLEVLVLQQGEAWEEEQNQGTALDEEPNSKLGQAETHLQVQSLD